MIRTHARRPRRTHPYLLISTVLGLGLLLWWSAPLLHTTYTLLAMPSTWWDRSRSFLISPAPLSAGGDGFDLTFANYSLLQDGAGEGFEDVIPAVLHHIALGPSAASAAAASGGGDSRKWHGARQACLEMHPAWEAKLWTDENARAFVQEKFPELLAMWDGYRFPIQRIDALRYLVLHEFGGAILDMDLECKRSLGPLRRFDFVAPAAFPLGFSNGFMMAPKGSAFVADIIRNLPRYNRHWFFLPYPTVMFSTGCHYASTIHSLQPDRSRLKILAGPTRDTFTMHSLNGRVTTPLFKHLGSSSWHSYDAALINWFGHLSRWAIGFLVVTVLGLGLVMARCYPCAGGKRSGIIAGPRWLLSWRRRRLGKGELGVLLDDVASFDKEDVV